MYLIFLAACCSAGLITTASVSSSTYSIRSSSNISFSVQLKTAIPLSGQVLIVFPSQFPISTQVYCSISGVTSGSSVVCSFSSSTLSLSNCFPTTSLTVSWTVYMVSTPLYSQITNSFQIYTLSSAGSVLDSVTTGLSLEYLPLSMPFASVTSKNSVSGQYSTWTFTLKTTYEVPGLYLSLPDWNSYLTPPDLLITTYCQNVVCQPIASIF